MTYKLRKLLLSLKNFVKFCLKIIDEWKELNYICRNTDDLITSNQILDVQRRILRYWENLAMMVNSFSKFHKEIHYLDLLTRQEKRRNSLFTDSIEVLMLEEN